jgi:hypothetical protein
MRPSDWAVLVIGLTVWAAWGSLVLYQGPIKLYFPMTVTTASGDGYPHVDLISPFWSGHDVVQQGDELVRFGDLDLRGRGPFRVVVAAFSAAAPDGRLAVMIHRRGEDVALDLDLQRPRLPGWVEWALGADGGLLVLAGALLLIGAPRSPAARPLFLSFIGGSTEFTTFSAGPAWQTYVLFLLLIVGSVTSTPLILTGLIRIPQPINGARQARLPRWPWLWAPLIGVGWWSSISVILCRPTFHGRRSYGR